MSGTSRAFMGIFVISTFEAISRATLRSCPVVVLTTKILGAYSSFLLAMGCFLPMLLLLLRRLRMIVV